MYKGKLELSYKIEFIKFEFPMLSGIRYFKNIKKEMESLFKQDSIIFTTSKIEVI